MAWWARRSPERDAAPGSAREQVARRRDRADAEIVAALAERTVTGTWTVDPGDRGRVTDGRGVVRYQLRPESVRSADGATLCTVRHPLHSGFTRSPGGVGEFLVHRHPGGPLIARVDAPHPGPVRLDLLPDQGALRENAAFRDRPWFAALQALGPLGYGCDTVGEGEVTGELRDRHGRVLLADHRRYGPARDSRVRWALRAWSLQPVANPLPDPWLLALMQAALHHSYAPSPRRAW